MHAKQLQYETLFYKNASAPKRGGGKHTAVVDSVFLELAGLGRKASPGASAWAAAPSPWHRPGPRGRALSPRPAP